MIDKRFKLRLSKLGNGVITDTQKREDLYFDKEFLDATLPKTNEWLNELADENEELKQYNDELISKIDFLERIIDGGYEVSDKFKDFMNDLNKSIENEKKKLERFGLND